MLTPRFTIDQDDDYVTVSIYAPFTHVAETEVFMDGTDFRFFSKPYFLRLHFPCEIVENDDASAKFDSESLSYVIKCPKKVTGEFFPNLDMITELCKPKGAVNTSQIEDLDKEEGNDDGDDGEEEWYIEQVVPAQEVENEKLFGLGFGMKHENVFTKLLEEAQEILDLKEPDKLNVQERRKARLEKEVEDFDPDHYLSDLLEPDDMLPEILHFQVDKSPDQPLKFSKEENQKLADFCKKDVKVKSKISTLCGLLDILYAYCYDHRVTFAEHSSESGWTISKLSATLVCSDKLDSVKEVVISTMRRSLIYPIYRNYDLSLQIWQDVQNLLKHGNVGIIKSLLKISSIFNESEGRYIFNQLYIDQYIAWTQKLKKGHLEKANDKIKALIEGLTKDDLELELTELEAAAEMVQKEEEEEALVRGMRKVELDDRKAKEDDSDDDDDSSSDDSSSEDSSSDSDTSSTENDENEPKNAP